MGTPTLTVMGRPVRVVAFVCGAFCAWWLLFVVPLACMACMCAWRCALPAWCPTNAKFHPTMDIGTAIFSRSCANLFWFFLLCCIQLKTISRKIHTSLLLITSFVSYYFRGASALLRCFGVASALLLRCFGVASSLLRHCFGIVSGSRSLNRGRNPPGWGKAPGRRESQPEHRGRIDRTRRGAPRRGTRHAREARRQPQPRHTDRCQATTATGCCKPRRLPQHGTNHGTRTGAKRQQPPSGGRRARQAANPPPAGYGTAGV